jgi:hypothetical protein
MSSGLAAQIFDRFVAQSGFAGGYSWSSWKKETAAENSAAVQRLLPLASEIVADWRRDGQS